MAERKTKRNARTPMIPDGFRITRKPVVRPVEDCRVAEADNVQLPRVFGRPILFVIARDPRTLFVSWHIDWASVFEKMMPIDRQVHVRLAGAEGVEEQRVTVEPMAATHFITMSGSHKPYRVEIGYYEPADFWNSVAISDEAMMPRNEIAQTADVDLATIPFHMSFQQLSDLFGSGNDTAVGAVISRFEKRVLSRDEPKPLKSDDKKILREIGVSLSDIGLSRRAFERIDTDKVARRADALLGVSATSPARAREGHWALAGS